MTPLKVTLTTNGDYWQARWTDALGRRKAKGLGRRVGKGAVSKGDADDRRRALEHEIQAGTVMAGVAPTLACWIKTFISDRPELATSTLKLYRRTGDVLLAFFGDCKLDKITPALASNWRGALLRGDLDCSPSIATAARMTREAKQLFGASRLPINPFVALSGSPPKPDRTWATVSEADLDRLWGACPSQGWRLLFGLCRLAGLRRGEALRLEWADVDMDSRRLTVLNPGPYETTKHRTRTVPIQPSLYDLLFEAWMADIVSESVVTGLPKESSIWKAARTIIRRAGLTVYSKPCHTLRKNLQTQWEGEFPIHVVAEWLGNSPRVALEHYSKAEAKDFEKVSLRGVRPASAPRSPSGQSSQ